MTETSTKSGRKRTFLLGGIMGAAAMWFLDPDRGNRRRHIAQDKLNAWSRRVRRQAGKQAAYAGGRAAGVAQQAFHAYPADNPNPDDNTLRDRVESELLRHPEVPKGRINIDVAGRIVTLRGELDSVDDVARVEELACKIEGVESVTNYLHVPGTPAPNKEEALAAS